MEEGRAVHPLLICLLLGLLAVTYHLWRSARIAVVSRCSRDVRAPGGRGGDALLIDLAAWMFALGGVALICAQGDGEQNSANAAGTTLIVAGAVLNVWAICCAWAAGNRRERRDRPLLVLITSAVMGIVVPLVILFGYFNDGSEVECLFPQSSHGYSCMRYYDDDDGSGGRTLWD